MNKKKLIQEASQAMEKAYTPYSRFNVGAAVLADDGRIFSGMNIENASYSLTNCAERTALFKAYSEGARTIKAIAVIAKTDRPISPCGACRQVMAELCERDTVVILTNVRGDLVETTVEALLPGAFTAEDLE